MKRIAQVLALVALAAASAGCAVVVEDGTAGVKADFGKFAQAPLGTGWHWYLPGMTWVEIWNIKTQEIEEQAQVPSSEGLISQLDVSVIYNVPQEKIVTVRRTIGRYYRETVLEPYIRDAIRNVV